jgi:glycosyltransferase involved in cell wall biosynthesis
MKILVCSRNFLPDLGGLERNTLTLAQSLTSLGHSTIVLTETLDDDQVTYPFKTIRSRDWKILLKNILWSDLVLINGGLSLKVCAFSYLFRRSYVPIYQTSDLFLRQNALWISSMLRRFTAGSARLSITVSFYAKTLLEQYLPGHTVYGLPNPIDPELEKAARRTTAGRSEKKHDLLFAGRIIDGKGVFHLVDAVAALRPELDLSVAFAGDGEHRDALLLYAREKGIRFSYLGRLDKEQLVQAYQEAHVLVVPSSTHTEGNPLVIAEALSLGTPVIASDQSAMVEAVGDAGLIFRRGDVNDLSKTIRSMFHADQLQQATISTVGRSAEFSYRIYLERLNAALSSPRLLQKK